MKGVSDAGKVLLYLWNERSVFLGRVPEEPSFTPAAPVLFAGLERPLMVERGGTVREVWTVAVPVGHSVSIDTNAGIVACCYLDPWGRDLAAASRWLNGEADGLTFAESPLAVIQECFRELYAGRIDQTSGRTGLRPRLVSYFADEVKQRLNRELFVPIHTLPSPDDSVVDAIRLIRSGIDPVNLAGLASMVGLSQSQLSKRFQAETGLTLRRYRLWNRLFLTACYLQFGRSLTDASLRAGFSDSAHFANTTRDIIGIRPSSILKVLDRLQIFLGSDVVIPEMQA